MYGRIDPDARAGFHPDARANRRGGYPGPGDSSPGDSGSRNSRTDARTGGSGAIEVHRSLL